ncbi:FhaA domain-containing protein [Protofrankia symbiont of Coriaria ruscifolia]|uniref:FhaA domain-containing protein n=1 Tax=Protofrankia symbiont of Coriaria ruscifolia TaxID=1306542 RepID=UPI00104181D2|nr:DUF3662 and FHA domain-containing protein [Protofrankia symbiont of Coriaria ruscifolia]
MGVLQRFERRLGGLVEGAFAKVFKGGVEPVEIASALARETDDRRATSSNRVLVPNEFAVELASSDFARLAPYTGALCDELAEMVREHAAEQRYTFVGPVGVRLAEAEDLDVGVFRIRSSVAAADPGAVAGRRPVGRPRPTAPGAPRLVISTKPGPDSRASGEEREYPLDSEVTVIGRSVECDIRLNDTGVSRRHGEVRRMPDGQFVYIDHGSTNGSIVNGRAASQVKLMNGDQIELGATILAFRRDDPRGADRGRAPGRVPAGAPGPGGVPAGPAGAYPPAPAPPAAPVDPRTRSADPRRGDPRHGVPPGGYPPPPADPYRGEPYRGGDPYRGEPRRGGPPEGYPPEGYPPAPADPYRDDPYRDDPRLGGAASGYPAPPGEAPYQGGGRPTRGQPAGGRPGDPYGGGPRYDDPYGEREGQYRGGNPYDQFGGRVPGTPPAGYGPGTPGPGTPAPGTPGPGMPGYGGQAGYGDPRRNVAPAGPDGADMHEQETHRPGRVPPVEDRRPHDRDPYDGDRPAGPGAPGPNDRGW